MLERPQPHEYNPFFANYIKSVPDGDLLELLKTQHTETMDLLKNATEAQGSYRYAEGKWSLKEVLGHVADTERVMSYRLLAIARGDTSSSLPSFNQNSYVEHAGFDRLELQQVKSELSIVRQSTLSLAVSLSDEAWLQCGIVSTHSTTARALAYIIAGHELHHLAIIKDKYLSL